jgi:hypothetical protein
MDHPLQPATATARRTRKLAVFPPSRAKQQLPHSLLDRFKPDCPSDRLAQALRFLAPLSVPSMIK